MFPSPTFARKIPNCASPQTQASKSSLAAARRHEPSLLSMLMASCGIIRKPSYVRCSSHRTSSRSIRRRICSWFSTPKQISSFKVRMPPSQAINTISSPSLCMSNLPPNIKKFWHGSNRDRIMHGLGFMSLWQNWLSIQGSLTPNPTFGNPTSSDGVQFQGFVETAYDRMMTLTNFPGISCSNLSEKLNDVFGLQGVTFPDVPTIAHNLSSSAAIVYSQYMNGNATEQNAIAASPPLTSPSNATLNTEYSLGGPIILETSFTPFALGSSLIHVDANKYHSTQDFLMRFTTPMGKTLAQFIADYGNSGDQMYGAFGPGLRYILAGIGYRIRGGVPLGGSVPNSGSDVGEGVGGGGGSGSGSGLRSSASHGFEIGGFRRSALVGFVLWLSVYWVCLGI